MKGRRRGGRRRRGSGANSEVGGSGGAGRNGEGSCNSSATASPLISPRVLAGDRGGGDNALLFAMDEDSAQ